MNPNAGQETYISIDVETAGPNPSQYSLLSIGACTLEEPQETFYIELKPVNDRAAPEALEISGLSLERLAAHGVEPAEALRRFEEWLMQITPKGKKPLFVAFNAPFDWMFVNDYFHRYLGHNPFGHSALDVKSYYMGLAGVTWAETSMRYVSPRYLGDQRLSHHALQDAQDQAQVFKKMLAEARKGRKPQT